MAKIPNWSLSNNLFDTWKKTWMNDESKIRLVVYDTGNYYSLRIYNRGLTNFQEIERFGKIKKALNFARKVLKKNPYMKNIREKVKI